MAALSLTEQRQQFLKAEKTLLSKGTFSQISDGLDSSYPLYFYLEYQWLSKHLSETKHIKQFLKKHQSRYSQRLKRKWLNRLYKQQRWNDFVTHFNGAKSTAMQCRYQWANYQRNHKTQALKATRQIWLSGKSLPDDCNALLKVFKKSNYLTQDLVWQRFKLAIKSREKKLAIFLSKTLTNKQRQKHAKFWLKLLKNPKFLVKKGSLSKVSRSQQAEMMVYAMRRLVNQDVDKAANIWQQRRGAFKLTASQINTIERSIALQYTFNKSPKANKYFKRLTHLDKTSRTWSVRAALLAEDWRLVQKRLKQLTKEEREENRWQYWQARTFFKLGKQDKAILIFKKLASQRSYYGFIAADFLQQKYALNNSPIKVDAEKLKQLLKSDDFLIMQEFMAIEKTKTAQLYWWSALKKLKQPQLLIAAKIAQTWGWDKQAMIAVARAKHWNDVDLRFPMNFVNEIKQNAKNKALAEPIIYGLIRRESMFDELAKSPVGALGLMQVMPQTGKQIAKAMKLKKHSSKQLLKASLNINFGSFYYKQMLDKFDSHFALAAAAYNAGPHRVKRWLSQDVAMAADIWVESIPYKETREYVAAVLTYALIYQQKLTEKNMRMSFFLKDIKIRQDILK